MSTGEHFRPKPETAASKVEREWEHVDLHTDPGHGEGRLPGRLARCEIAGNGARCRERRETAGSDVRNAGNDAKTPEAGQNRLERQGIAANGARSLVAVGSCRKRRATPPE